MMYFKFVDENFMIFTLIKATSKYGKNKCNNYIACQRNCQTINQALLETLITYECLRFIFYTNTTPVVPHRTAVTLNPELGFLSLINIFLPTNSTEVTLCLLLLLLGQLTCNSSFGSSTFPIHFNIGKMINPYLNFVFWK